MANWVNQGNAPICIDASPYPVWNDWEANQRDLFMTDMNGQLVYKQNITSGIPANIIDIILAIIIKQLYNGKIYNKVITLLFITTHFYITYFLVNQHLSPSAISQINKTIIQFRHLLLVCDVIFHQNIQYFR